MGGPERQQGRLHRWKLAALAAFTWLLPGEPAKAVILADCDTSDDFCVGDPCTTSDVIETTVASCVLDFGSRTLVITRKVGMPNNGVLSLTAGAIEVKGKLDGKNATATAGDGGDISLFASGDISVERRIDVSGRASSGAIVLDAGGNVELRQQLRARAKGAGATASGGSISVTADGTISATRRAKIDVRGRREHTPAGQVALNAQRDMAVLGRIEARGSAGGSVALDSAAGKLSVQEEIRIQGSPGQCGSATLGAGGDLDISGRKGKIAGEGGLGNVSIDAGGTATVLLVRLKAIGLPVGTVAVTAGTVAASRIFARGKTDGGVIAIQSTVGDVYIDTLDVSGRTHGGRITVDSAANLAIQDADADGGDFGGEMRFATAQNLVLGTSIASNFLADGDVGGVIEGQAGGDLIAEGDFEAREGGCIGLAAGGSLDTSGATFDVPLSGSCP